MTAEKEFLQRNGFDMYDEHYYKMASMLKEYSGQKIEDFLKQQTPSYDTLTSQLSEAKEEIERLTMSRELEFEKNRKLQSSLSEKESKLQDYIKAWETQKDNVHELQSTIQQLTKERDEWKQKATQTQDWIDVQKGAYDKVCNDKKQLEKEIERLTELSDSRYSKQQFLENKCDQLEKEIEGLKGKLAGTDGCFHCEKMQSQLDSLREREGKFAEFLAFNCRKNLVNRGYWYVNETGNCYFSADLLSSPEFKQYLNNK